MVYGNQSSMMWVEDFCEMWAHIFSSGLEIENGLEFL